MKQEIEDKFTKYEIARVIGARALQIAMDAPVLIKISDEELKEINFDAIRIAEKEFESGALPIAINRPLPQKRKRVLVVKEEEVSDEELLAKAREVEKEIAENPREYSIIQEEEVEESEQSSQGIPREQ